MSDEGRTPPRLREQPSASGRESEALRAELGAGMDANEVSFRELVQNANTIVLRWDLQGRITFLNEFGLQLFGYEHEQLIGRSVIGTIVPPTDTSGRDLVQMIDQLLARPEEYVHNENENMRRDGGRLWITWRNRVLRDGAGRPRELLSFGMDTTARRRAEEAARDRERRYQVLFQSTPIALVERDVSALKAHLDDLQAAGVGDLDAYLREHPEALATCLGLVRVTDLNAAAMELFETRDPAALQSFGYVDDPVRFASLARALIATLASGRAGSEELEGTLHTPSGTQRYVLARSIVVPGSESSGARVISALVDVTERRRAVEALRASEEQFRFLAVHDGLTGLYNRRYLYEHLPRLVGGAGAPCAVIFMDLDRFKQVVDAYGHLNGSRAIQEVAEIIRTCITEPAFAVAYAGDEFVIVLPGRDTGAAVAAATEIRARLGAHIFLAAAGHTVRLTASFGVAVYPRDAGAMDDLLAVADRTLFRAKAAGRNLILTAGAEAAPPRPPSAGARSGPTR
jgi:diguanylate cyclase (GGDEF)-like protein/PAS domain S-box-containing protein